MMNFVLVCCSPDEDYNFWSIIRPKMMEENVEMIEMVLRDTGNLHQKSVNCRACQKPLEWMFMFRNEDGEFDPECIEFR